MSFNRTYSSGVLFPENDSGCCLGQAPRIEEAGQARMMKPEKAALWKAGLVKSAITVFVVAGLAGCAPHTADYSMPVNPPETFSAGGAGNIPDHWWTVFNDTQLDLLVAEALQSNFNLLTAWNRLRAARAVFARQSAALYPALDGFLEAERSGLNSEASEQMQLGLSAQYEVDLWGRIQSAVEAERYRAEATRADYKTVALTLSAEVARTWYQLLEAHKQLDLFHEQIDTNGQVLDLLKTRFERGQIRIADVLRQQQLLESTREQMFFAQSRVQVLEHRLAVLLGQPPMDPVTYTRSDLPDLPPLPATGLPAELLRRRPDVETAFNELQAADRDLASAISNRYPRLTLSGTAAAIEDETADLSDDWVHALAGNLLAPLYDGGQREAEVNRTYAVREQRLFEYGQAILSAFQEVENALVQERKQSEQFHSLAEQVRLAEQTSEQLQQEYFNGAGAYIDVLIALTEEQRLRRSLLAAELLRLEFRIALYRALAGGFSTEGESINGL